MDRDRLHSVATVTRLDRETLLFRSAFSEAFRLLHIQDMSATSSQFTATFRELLLVVQSAIEAI